MAEGALLQVNHLSVGFRAKNKPLAEAVRSVSYDVHRGEILAIVGESGSGKSVSAMGMLGLLPKSAVVSGSAVFDGDELISMERKKLRSYRGRRIAMIFQDPMTAFHPVFTIGSQIAEAMEVHGVDSSTAFSRAGDLLEMVGVPEPGIRVNQYPHEFSGGMRQRAMVAMAIANKPDLLIADEPTTALDVTIQAQVMEVLADVQREVDAAMILITHDLGVVANVADRVQVMYGGRIVERGDTRPMFHSPANPYTRGLLSSLPRLDGSREDRLVPIPGSPPSILNMPVGCAFAPRCPHATDVCTERPAELIAIEGTHFSRCHNTASLPEWSIQGVSA
jgi:oligopeptide/dipeptide ABC transporter ATP-binding protein